jgi:hypothetical protein
MDKDDIQKRILEDEDYIRCPKFSNSITKFVAKNPEGVEDNVIGRLLVIPEEKVEEIYQEAIEILKKDMANNE